MVLGLSLVLRIFVCSLLLFLQGLTPLKCAIAAVKYHIQLSWDNYFLGFSCFAVWSLCEGKNVPFILPLSPLSAHVFCLVVPELLKWTALVLAGLAAEHPDAVHSRVSWPEGSSGGDGELLEAHGTRAFGWQMPDSGTGGYEMTP